MMLEVSLAALVFLALAACAVVRPPRAPEEALLEETLALVRDVKEFGRSLGIEPSEALSTGGREGRVRSMLWLWLQRRGTLAVEAPIDVRLGIRFSAAKEELPLERLYNAGDYSVYFRQGNQFGDRDSVTTIDFARQPLVSRVKTVLHEDLHDEKNFDLPWEIEESIVTPLGLLAARKYFEKKGDRDAAAQIEREIEAERAVSRQLAALVAEALAIFQAGEGEAGRRKVLRRVAAYADYYRYYRHQLDGQEELLALEAKLSHDLAYYRYFDRVVSLYERTKDLRRLITDLKRIPKSATFSEVESFLRDLG